MTQEKLPNSAVRTAGGPRGEVLPRKVRQTRLGVLEGNAIHMRVCNMFHTHGRRVHPVE